MVFLFAEDPAHYAGWQAAPISLRGNCAIFQGIWRKRDEKSGGQQIFGKLHAKTPWFP